MQQKGPSIQHNAPGNRIQGEELKMKKGINTNSIRRFNDNTWGPSKLNGVPKKIKK